MGMMRRSLLWALAMLLGAVSIAGDEEVSTAGDAEVTSLVQQATEAAVNLIQPRLAGLLEGTFTDACRKEVLNSFHDYLTRFVREDYLPFERDNFRSKCPSSKVNLSGPKKSPKDIRLAFLMMVHEQGFQAKRLVQVLQEPGHNFIVHVDGKAESNDLHEELLEYAKTQTNVFIMREGRMNVSWGGFNMVQATLNGIAHALELGIDFDWLINLSGYSYPLMSNDAIRRTLSDFPTDTNLMEIRPSANVPADRTWHYFVECDNMMRRIWRLKPPRGISMYVGSQWFIISKAFATYLKDDRHFVPRYIDYGRHTMVADENFFATVIKNSPFCHTHHNRNLVHVQFDKWEHDKNGRGARDPKKCLQPNPDHCGRSPTVNSIDYLPVLELSRQMFARKFDPEHDSAILDAIDSLRARDETREGPFFRSVMIKQQVPWGWASKSYHCMELGARPTEPVTMQPCQPGNPNQRFEVGPCSSDGSLTVEKDQPINVTEGDFSRPFCPIRAHNRRCLDLEGERIKPGTSMISYQCTMKWNQLFSFGSGLSGSIFINIPYTNHKPKHLCLESASHSKASVMRSELCDPDQDLQTFVFEEV